jgi:hypothetical protein
MVYYSTRQDRRLTGSTFLTRRILDTRIGVMKALNRHVAHEGPMTVLIYVDTSKQVGDPDHLKVFANVDAVETWFANKSPCQLSGLPSGSVGSHWRYHIDQPVVLTLHRDQTSRLSRDFPSHFQRGILVYVFEKDNAALPRKRHGGSIR